MKIIFIDRNTKQQVFGDYYLGPDGFVYEFVESGDFNREEMKEQPQLIGAIVNE
jgi:hypothetical protein